MTVPTNPCSLWKYFGTQIKGMGLKERIELKREKAEERIIIVITTASIY